MRRREFIAGLGGAVAWPLAARAQRSGLPRVGLLYSATRFTDLAFRRGLREAGFFEGQNVVFEYRSAGGDYNRLSAYASELAEMPVDVIAAFGSPAARAAKVASQKSVPATPVVFTMASDPVIEGYVQSLNRPGGNITGVTSISVELAPKRLELMRELLPNDATIGFLINPSNPLSETERKVIKSASIVVGQRIVGKILKGQHPAELPVQQPTRFELIVNLKAAKALGIEFPHKLLAVADEVIE